MGDGILVESNGEKLYFLLTSNAFFIVTHTRYHSSRNFAALDRRFALPRRSRRELDRHGR